MTAATTLAEKIERVQRLEVLGVLAGGIVHDLNNIFLVEAGRWSLVADSSPTGARPIIP